MTLKGEIVKNKLTNDLLKIKEIEKGEVVILDHEKGLTRTWLHEKHLEYF